MKWHESLVEKKIREAMEEGVFQDLEGKGEPIDLSENPFEDPDLRTVHRLLRNAGFAPAWIEERKNMTAELLECRSRLQNAWALFGEVSEHRNLAEWERALAEFKDRVAELNQRIRIYNLKAPATVFHTKHIEAQKLIDDVTAEHNSGQ